MKIKPSSKKYKKIFPFKREGEIVSTRRTVMRE
jgi:hypothetical protein